MNHKEYVNQPSYSPTIAYVLAQFERLGDPNNGDNAEYVPRMQITSESGHTNWINITWQEVEQIKTLLIEGR